MSNAGGNAEQPTTHTLTPTTRLVVACPSCNKHEFRFDHVLGKLAGPWYCDWCDARTMIDSRSYKATGKVAVTSDPRSKRVWLICELVPQADPVRVAYEVLDNYEPYRPQPDADERLGSFQYLVEEHQCPTNITGSIEAVFVGRDDDTHGLFRFTGVVVPARRKGSTGSTGDDSRWVEQHAPGALGAGK